jgi:flagellar hook protein FlgE
MFCFAFCFDKFAIPMCCQLFGIKLAAIIEEKIKGYKVMMSVIRSGMDAALLNLDVTSNNIANARTTGYKQRQASFVDMYSTSITTASGDRLGIGVQMPGVHTKQTQGNLQKTNTVMDLAIEGEGLFALRDVANPNANVYTRDGSFTLNKEGNIVSRDGYNLMSSNNEPINIPLRATGILTDDGFRAFGKENNLTSIVITENGNIQATYGGANVVSLGKVGLASFSDPNRLTPIGANIFRHSKESGLGILGEPVSNGLGKIHSGALEMANTNITDELSNMIRAQQAFSGSSRLLQSEVEMMKSLI